MKQIGSGDPYAFEELYDRYADRAYRVARSICPNHDHAEEAVQDAFAGIWRNRTAYLPGRGTVAAWLVSIVRYRSIGITRRHASYTRRRAPEDTSQAGCATSGEMADGVVARAGAAQVLTLLKQLPDTQLEVITLAYYGQLTHSEIATQLGLPPGTVKGRMRLGLQKLRADIEPSAA